MRLGAVRLGDFVLSKCRHKSPGPFITGCKTTFVNNRPQVRINDKSIPGRAITGSKTKLIGGRGAVRLKDKVKCGVIIKASKDTFIGN